VSRATVVEAPAELMTRTVPPYALVGTVTVTLEFVAR